MKTPKTEQYYYLKVSPGSPSKVYSSFNETTGVTNEFSFEYPSYLAMSRVQRQSKESRLFQESNSHFDSAQFYEIALKKSLSSSDLQSYLMMNCSKSEGPHQKTENCFEIRLSDIIKVSVSKENFTEKLIIPSVNSTCKMEIIIIPSYHQLTAETLEKIVGCEDSKITVDTFARLENLPTEQSLGYAERKGKFQRTAKEQHLKLEKRPKNLIINKQSSYLKCPEVIQLEKESPKKGQSPLKRCIRMRRSQLIPQQFHCEMEQVDEHQAWQYFRQNVSNISYVLGLLLQLFIIFQLMTPSSKI